MILDSIADVKKYVSISETLKFADFQPYIKKAVNQFTYKYIGALDVELAEETAEAAPNAVLKNEARELLREVLSNFGLLLYLPIAQVQFDGSGMTTAQNDRRKTAEWWQVKDIARDFMTSGHYAMDRLLKHLEANTAIFTDFKTNYSTLNSELIVSSTDIFNKYYNIFESRQTFLALLPSIRQVEDQYISTFLCPEVIALLKTAVTNNFHKSVKENLQKAIVAFTVSKVCDEGMFLLDATGLKLKYDLLPSETARIGDYGKQADQITRTAAKQFDNGVTYLSLARQTIEAHLSDFNQCEVVFINDKSVGSGFQPYDTLGVLGL